MALYDGFFDAVLSEDTYQYDREYDSGSFTEYFGKVVGSGVCVHGNEDSMKVGLNGTSAFIAPGYLFIQGHWLKNTAEYAVPISGTGVHAVFAKLNMGARRIEVGSQPKADPEEYPNTLVLAYVTVDNGGAVSVEDTRYRTDICGVINSAGALASKVEWAIHYINNEIELKLKQVEADIKAQEAVLDAKIEEVNTMMEKLAPPPIGTVKFSASSEIEDGWLRCDGSFVSETDYPELVAALGKKYPGSNEFYEVANGSVAGHVSTSAIYSGRCWVYHLESQTLHGFSITDKSKVQFPVSGVDGFAQSVSNPVVLSICDGTVYLAQTAESMTDFLLYESEKSLDEGPEDILCTRLDVSGRISTNANSRWFSSHLPGDIFVPEVVSVQSGAEKKLYLCLGVVIYDMESGSYKYKRFSVISLSWTKGNFASAECTEHLQNQTNSTDDFNNILLRYTKSLFRFSRKNSGELFSLKTSGIDSGAGRNYKFFSESVPNGLFSNTSTDLVDYNSFEQLQDSVFVSPVCYNGSYIYRVMLSDGKIILRAGKYQPQELFDPADGMEQAVPVSIPPIGRLFQDSVECAKSQGLWIIFVGSGILFSRAPLDLSSWGYLDTTGVLGVITAFGGVEYDEATNSLCIVGRDTTSNLKVGIMKFDEIFDYANDGAWLPMIASDGIPAYIKAKEAT